MHIDVLIICLNQIWNAGLFFFPPKAIFFANQLFADPYRKV